MRAKFTVNVPARKDGSRPNHEDFLKPIHANGWGLIELEQVEDRDLVLIGEVADGLVLRTALGKRDPDRARGPTEAILATADPHRVAGSCSQLRALHAAKRLIHAACSGVVTVWRNVELRGVSHYTRERDPQHPKPHERRESSHFVRKRVQ